MIPDSKIAPTATAYTYLDSGETSFTQLSKMQ